jgi:hypothetical protein
MISRRSFGVGALGAAGAFAQPTAHAQESAQSDPARREPVLVGANPAVQLFDDAGGCAAYASCWRVDWSTHGPGIAIVLWRPEGVRVVSEPAALGPWLAETFVRHFPELEGLPWPDEIDVVAAEVELDVDLARGMTAFGGGVAVEAEEVLDVRAFATDEFPLGETVHSLSLVLAPCGKGSVHVDGVATPGALQLGGTEERPSSSAFCTEAEVWRL